MKQNKKAGFRGIDINKINQASGEESYEHKRARWLTNIRSLNIGQVKNGYPIIDMGMDGKLIENDIIEEEYDAIMRQQFKILKK